MKSPTTKNEAQRTTVPLDAEILAELVSHLARSSELLQDLSAKVDYNSAVLLQNQKANTNRILWRLHSCAESAAPLREIAF